MSNTELCHRNIISDFSPMAISTLQQLSGDEVVIEDASGEVCGSVHLGRGTLCDATGATVAEIHRDGTLVGSINAHILKRNSP